MTVIQGFEGFWGKDVETIVLYVLRVCALSLPRLLPEMMSANYADIESKENKENYIDIEWDPDYFSVFFNMYILPSFLSIDDLWEKIGKQDVRRNSSLCSSPKPKSPLWNAPVYYCRHYAITYVSPSEFYT